MILIFTEKKEKQTVGSVVRNIKARVKKYANQHDIPFARQGNFHDHIIRDEKELDRIREYIRNNPLKRLQDIEL